MTIAVIDLGTNTFNLIIAEITTSNQIHILLNTKEGVKLAEGGINRKHIGSGAFQRGLSAIGRHMERIKNYEVNRIRAFATSAIRDADNGADFLQELKQAYALEVEIISGEREAELIYQGVRQTLPSVSGRFLILDIGGGSNEFIIADTSKIYWKHSFRLGMARLLDRFHPSDPITTEEISRIESYLDGELSLLFRQVQNLKPELFIGASGSFDSFVALLSKRNLMTPEPGSVFHEIPMQVYETLHAELLTSTRDQRNCMEELEPVRRDMIVLASIFVTFVLRKTGLKIMYQSAYSLKEGALLESTQKPQS